MGIFMDGGLGFDSGAGKSKVLLSGQNLGQRGRRLVGATLSTRAGDKSRRFRWGRAMPKDVKCGNVLKKWR